MAGGALIGGLMLDLIGFPTGLAAHGGLPTHIASKTLTELGLVFGPGVATLLALSGAIFLAYNLTRERLASIQTVLAARRSDLPN